MKRLVLLVVALVGVIVAAIAFPAGAAPTVIKAPGKPVPTLVRFGLTPSSGQTLNASNGTWANSPTSFSYQWEDCDTAGNNCTSIGGATGNTYVVAGGDVGRTIRVVVTASNASGSTQSTSAATGVVTTSTFTTGVCSPSPCTTNLTLTGYTIPSVIDTPVSPYCIGGNDASGNPYCGTATPKNETIYVDRPNNLSTSSPAPAVIITSCALFTASGNWGQANQGWATEAAQKGFIVVIWNGPSGCGGINFNATDINANNGASFAGRSCGTGSSVCDLMPALASTIAAIEQPFGTGAGQNVNPNEVFGHGGSSEGLIWEAAACDTRTSSKLAGVSVESYSLFGTPGSGLATLGNAMPPNCPAVLGLTAPFGQSCWWDCVNSVNSQLSMQWIYGTSDSLFCSGCMSNGGPITTAAPCTTGGVDHCWVYGLKQLAATAANGLGNSLGCPSSGSTAPSVGHTNSISVTTYAGCTSPHTATQVVTITGGGHIPDTFCTNAVGIVCPTGTVVAASDGMFAPAAAWNFWSTYYAR